MMDAQKTPPELGQARERFLELVAEVRPELHRYCARMVGSSVDGEDVVQDVLARGLYAVSLSTDLPQLRPWLFRVAHNTAIDFLRRYDRRRVEPRADLDDTAGAEEPPDPAVQRAALASFLDLPASQRCAVILKDVLGHSLEETAETMDTTIPAVKAALVRGRATLRARRDEAPPGDDVQAPDAAASRAEREQLQRYVALFNGRDWDGLRALLGEECRLDLVSKAARRGKEIHGYFGRYAAEPDARLAVGTVEGRPALLLFNAKSGARPAYFILLDFTGDRVSLIRDFRYVPYIAAEAEMAAEP